MNYQSEDMEYGGIYLLHLNEKMSHSQHYLGFAESSIGNRVTKHLKGQGARMTQVAAERGIGMTVTRTWPDADRNAERKLKNRKDTPKLCPICNPDGWMRMGNLH